MSLHVLSDLSCSGLALGGCLPRAFIGALQRSMSMKISATLRSIFVGLLSFIATATSYAATHTATYSYIDWGQVISSPILLVDPAAPAIDVHVTGEWTFVFSHEDFYPPATVELAYAPSLNVFFVQGNDGIEGIDLGNFVAHTTIPDFTGVVSLPFHVDHTQRLINHGDLSNFMGYGDTLLFVEDFLGGGIPLNDVDGIVLGDVFVRDLSITITAVPEPAGYVLAMLGFAVVLVAHCVLARAGRKPRRQIGVTATAMPDRAFGAFLPNAL